jgi:hypothetical protein
VTARVDDPTQQPAARVDDPTQQPAVLLANWRQLARAGGHRPLEHGLRVIDDKQRSPVAPPKAAGLKRPRASADVTQKRASTAAS